MPNKSRAKSLLERKLENLEYRKRHEERYEAFKLEVQILNALQKKGWSYTDLAQAINTHKSNISRDLKGGGILSATFSRISRIAEALEMKLIALLIPKEEEQFILPRIGELVRLSFNAASGDIKMAEPPKMVTQWRQDMYAKINKGVIASLKLVENEAVQNWVPRTESVGLAAVRG
jgi:hypothetical protein